MVATKFNSLVVDIIEAANEVFDENNDLGFPQNRDSFMRAMWQDDAHMERWLATRAEYTEAMHEAYAMLTRERWQQ